MSASLTGLTALARAVTPKTGRVLVPSTVRAAGIATRTTAIREAEATKTRSAAFERAMKHLEDAGENRDVKSEVQHLREELEERDERLGLLGKLALFGLVGNLFIWN